MQGMLARDEVSPVALQRQDYWNSLHFAPWHGSGPLITSVSNVQPSFGLVVNRNRVGSVSRGVYHPKAKSLPLMLKLLAIVSIVAYVVLWRLHAESATQ